MDQREFTKAIDSERVQLGFWDAVLHYMIVLVFFAGSVMMFYFLLTSDDDGQIERSINGLLFFFPLSVVFFIIQFRRLRFIKLETSLSHEGIWDVIKSVEDVLKWKKISAGKDYYIAETLGGFLNSGPTSITILLVRNKMFISSICPPYYTDVTAWGGNSENIKTFREELETFETLKSNQP